MKTSKLTKVIGWTSFLIGAIILSGYMDTLKDVLVLSFGVGLTDAGLMIAKYPEIIMKEK